MKQDLKSMVLLEIILGDRLCEFLFYIFDLKSVRRCSMGFFFLFRIEIIVNSWEYWIFVYSLVIESMF
jgi:hypothetical protein